MALYKLLLPKMGESISEATLISYNKKVGDRIEEDDTIADVATDKVDSEVPSPVSGVIKELPHQIDDAIAIGDVLALIETDGDEDSEHISDEAIDLPLTKEVRVEQTPVSKAGIIAPTANTSSQESLEQYSPLVRTICAKENIPLAELVNLQGTGLNGRITKKDILAYVNNKVLQSHQSPVIREVAQPAIISKSKPSTSEQSNSTDTVIEMDRMRRMIADHMVHSKHTSPHVSTFLEIDVTNIVEWRKKNKELFLKKYDQKLTYTPIFFEAISKAIADFPGINASTSDNRVILKKDINIGMAAALPTGNLIVPVIKNADRKSLIGLATEVNDLAARARLNKLAPDEIKGGTFTVSNIGTFGNDAGTPIINQPQAAILALGAINKKPAVVETEIGDVIAIRHRMILSISFDHRIVDGFLGGSFLRRVGDYMEQFDSNTKI